MARGISMAKRFFIAAEDKRAQAVDPFLDALLAEPPKPEILGSNAAREALESAKRLLERTATG